MDHDDRGDGSRVMSNPNFHTTGAHYLNADTTAFMQLIQGDLFAEFPSNRSCGHSAALGEPVWAAPGPHINRWVDVGIKPGGFLKASIRAMATLLEG